MTSDVSSVEQGLDLFEWQDFGDEVALPLLMIPFLKFESWLSFFKVSKPEIRFRNSGEAI